MRFGTRSLLAALLGIAAAAVVGCGSSASSSAGLLSAADSSTISAQLDSISQDVSSGSCAKARLTLSKLNNTLADLPSDTNGTIVRALSAGAQKVKSLALADCQKSPATTTSSTSSTPSVPSTPSTTEPTPTTTSTPAPSPTSTATSTATQTVTQSQSEPGVGTGGVTALGSPTTTNGGAGLNPGGGQ